MSSLEVLVTARKYLRSTITRQYNLKDNLATLSEVERIAKREKFKGILTEIKEYDTQIRDIKWSTAINETEMDSEFAVCENYVDQIMEILALLANRPTLGSDNSSHSLLKNPTIPLPSFHSSPEENVDKFFKEFESVAQQQKFSDRDKFLLLKQQVHGRAKYLINSLELDSQSYTKTKELLRSAFASTSLQKYNTVKMFAELKLKPAEDPFLYIGKVRSLVENMTVLKMKPEDFAQFFVWEGLNDSFKQHLINITNKIRPDLEEINKYFFEASDRYIQDGKLKARVSDKSRSDNNSVNFAIAVEKVKNPIRCCLCSSDSDHKISECNVYETPEAKVKRLKELGRCLKCGGHGHRAKNCSFRFHKKCVKCSLWHFSYLCTYDPKTKDNKGERKANEKVQSAEVTHAQVKNSSVMVNGSVTSRMSDSALPTFTGRSNGKTFRGLLDYGSQGNFITTELASTLKCKILSDGQDVEVNGFNASRKYKTRIVEVNLSMSDKNYTVPAVCVPCIDVNISIPNISKLAQAFQNRGFAIADVQLSSSDSISDVKFVLGTMSAHCLLISTRLLGDEDPVAYLDSPMGVLFTGDVNLALKYIGNTDFVVHKTEFKLASFLCTQPRESEVDEWQGSGDKKESNFVLQVKKRSFDKDLNAITDQVLLDSMNEVLNYENLPYEEDSGLNTELVKNSLSNVRMNEDGRITLPLMWNQRVSHLLGQNYNLSKAVLSSNLRKLKKYPERIKMVDEVIKEQVDMGIIERIPNLEDFLRNHPEASFLAHMPIFKLNKETTKCRIVYLSNLGEKVEGRPLTVTHNQAIHPGPNLNQKLSTAVLNLRFGSKLLCYDITKAFNQIALTEEDQNKLLFFWYRNVVKDDFTVVAYKNLRLSFGLRCSPTLLMISLYYILVVNDCDQTLTEIKRLLYQLFYMDNGAYTCKSSEELIAVYRTLPSIFEPYKFPLQQFVTNDSSLQEIIDHEKGEETPQEVKLLGIQWSRLSDEIYTLPMNLDLHANTKRKVLKSIASNFDIFNFNGPILNRARIFLHNLQLNNKLGWDDVLDEELIKEWKCIANQTNSSLPIRFNRCIGERDSEYALECYVDASTVIYGVVVYARDVKSGKRNFVLAKNKFVNHSLKAKSVPSLELQALVMGCETLNNISDELTGPFCLSKIKIVDLQLFSDSLVALNWLYASVHKLEKANKRTVFVNNRIERIQKICEKIPITFSYIAGVHNPADFITRPVSSKVLSKTNFCSGPSEHQFEETKVQDEVLRFRVPNLFVQEIDLSMNLGVVDKATEHLVPLDWFSSLNLLIRVHARVLRAVNIWKALLQKKVPHPCSFEIRPIGFNFYIEAWKQIIRAEQRIEYPEITDFFERSQHARKDIPNLVTQLNIYPDQNNILRIHGKFDKIDSRRVFFPVLLSKDSILTSLIIRDAHIRLGHAGYYGVLNLLRPSYYVPHIFSVVKKSNKSCVTCRRYNQRPVLLNQSPYRQFRLEPSDTPFGFIYLDYCGPFTCKFCGESRKFWILCFSCMFTRAINLQVCYDMTVSEFLRALMVHVFEYGLPQLVISDLGTQIVAAANKVTDFLNDPKTNEYFQENGISKLKFENYFKGCSSMGSLVEITVKMTKHMIYKSIGTNILDIRDFEYLVCQTKSLVNKRPISFLESLRDKELSSLNPITPEMLLHGYELVSINLIPELQPLPDLDDYLENKSPTDVVKDKYTKLRRVRLRLFDLYQNEFLSTLLNQAIDTKGRYKPCKHGKINVGDIVLIKDDHVKPVNFPMGIVKQIVTNVNGETTGAVVLKGKTAELSKRHVNSLIPLLSCEKNETNDYDEKLVEVQARDTELSVKPKTTRKAALDSISKTRDILEAEN